MIMKKQPKMTTVLIFSIKYHEYQKPIHVDTMTL
jgi:hypothetical protein